MSEKIISKMPASRLAIVVALCSLAASAFGANQYYTTTNNLGWSSSSSTNDWANSSAGPYNTSWTSGNTAVFEGTAGTVTVGGGGNPITGGITFSTNNYTLSSGTINLTGTPTIDTGTNTATIISILAGSGIGITKASSGTLSLLGVNTYSGGTTINAGTLIGGSTSAFGTGTINLNNSGTLGATVNNITNTVNIGAGGSTLSLNNNITLASAFTGSGTVTNFGSSFSNIRNFPSTANSGFTGAMVFVRGNFNFTGNNADWSGMDLQFNNSTVGADTGVGAVFNGVGTTVVKSASSFVGGMIQIGASTMLDVKSGNITRVASSPSGNTATPVIQPSSGSGGKLTSDSGTLTFNCVAGKITESSGVSLVDYNGLTPLNVVYTGAGANPLTLSGANAYTGTTAITNGTMQYSSPGSATLSGPVVGSSGALAFGAGTSLNIGGSGNVVALSVGVPLNLTNASLIYDWNSPASADVIDMANQPLTLSGVIAVGPANGVVTDLNGTYTLVRNASSITGSAANFALAAQRGATATFTVNATSITMTITSLGSGAVTNLYWQGTNAFWTAGAYYNWTNSPGGARDQFSSLDNVTFDDTAPATSAGTNITILGSVFPGSVVITNSSKMFTFSGGSIAGSGSLFKSGSSKATLNSADPYANGTTLDGGTLAALSSGSLGSGDVTIQNTAVALVVGDGTTMTNNITINGGSGQFQGLIQNSGTGVGTLSSGTITINAAPGSGGHFGNAGGSSGTLVVNDVVNSSVPVTWRSGSGVFSGGGSYSDFWMTGTVKLGANNGLSTTATLRIGNSGAATFDLGGFNQTLASINRFAANTAIIGNSSTTANSTLTLDNGSSTYGGIIQDAISPGTRTVSLVLNGGTLTLTNANTYSGGTLVSSLGSLYINYGGSGTANSAIGTGPLTIDASGGTLDNNSGSDVTLRPNNVQNWNGDFAYGGSGNLNLGTGAVTLGGNRLVTVYGNSLTVGGPIGDGGHNYSLTQNGPGVLVLSGTNTYGGSTAVSQGKVYVNGSLAASSAVSVSSGATLGGAGTINNTVNVASAGTIEAGSGLGSGTLTIKGLTLGASGSDTATLNLTRNATPGILKVTASGGLVVNCGAGNVTINVGGSGLVAGSNYTLITYSGAIGGAGFNAFKLGILPAGVVTAHLVNTGSEIDLHVDSLNFPRWKGGISSDWDLTTTNWVLNSDGVTPTLYTAGQAALFDDSATTFTPQLSTSLAPGLVTFNNTLNPYSLTCYAPLQGTGNLVKQGTNSLTIYGNNTYSGGTVLNAGLLNLNSPSASSADSAIGTGPLTINGGALDNTSGADLTLLPNNLQNWNADFTYVGSLYNLDLGAGAVTLNTNRQVTVLANTLAVDGAIGDGGAGYRLIKTGPGTLSLNGVNTFTGNTTISNGTLTIGGTGKLGAGAYAGNITNNGTLNFASSATETLSGVISGNGALTTSGGSGTVTLSGANTYSGGTTVTTTSDVGALAVSNNAALGTGPVTVVGGNQFSGAIQLGAGITVANAILLQPTSSGGGRAVITLPANSSLTGPITVDGSVNANNIAVLSATATAAPAAAAVVVTGPITHSGIGANPLTLRGSSAYGKVTGNISYGANTVQLLDNTTWELSGANTYGLLSISHANGTVYCGAANTLCPAAVVQDGITGGTLNLNNLAGTASYNQTIAGLNQTVRVTSSAGTPVLTLNGTVDCAQTNVISGTLSLVKAGPFTQTLAGANTYTGNTTVSAGTLSLSTPTLYANSTVTVASGAVLNLNYTATNRVGALVFNGSSQPPGTYGSSTPGGYITGSGYLLVPPPGPSSPGYITNSFNGFTLTLTWPAGQGWRLAIQTNHLAAGVSLNPTDWTAIPGSDSINQTNITINPAKPTEFYRLVYP